VPPLSPAAGDVHVWRVDLDGSAAALLARGATLSPPEQARADRFHFMVDRRRWVAAHIALRLILATFTDTAPERLCFAHGPQGKPTIAGAGDAWHFNLSHSRALALIAVTRLGPVGVDVEWRRPETPILEIARRVCASGELATFFGLPPADRPQAFYTCWTRKEALIKAEGSGMTAPLDRFEVSLDPDHPARALQVHADHEAAAGWSSAISISDRDMPVRWRCMRPPVLSLFWTGMVD